MIPSRLSPNVQKILDAFMLAVRCQDSHYITECFLNSANDPLKEILETIIDRLNG
jgi:hypothetical protein